MDGRRSRQPRGVQLAAASSVQNGTGKRKSGDKSNVPNGYTLEDGITRASKKTRVAEQSDQKSALVDIVMEAVVNKDKQDSEAKEYLRRAEKDPTFESNVELPFISTASHSRLIMRAVLMNDMKLLMKLMYEEPEKIYSLGVRRSTKNMETALDYAIKTENREAFKILYKASPRALQKFGNCPALSLSKEETGHGSHLMYGYALREVSVGRGGMEGNNAFLHDQETAYNLPAPLTFDGANLVRMALKQGISSTFIEFIMEQLNVPSWDFYNIYEPMRKGHFELVGKHIAKANEKGGYGFNFLHEETLTKQTGSSLTKFWPNNVAKKCTYDPQFTPLHCAAINPNPDMISTLLKTLPDLNLADAHGWTLGHYAAVCCSPEPLKYLLELGNSTDPVTSIKEGGEGFTLLHAAVSAGRAHNVEVLLEHDRVNNVKPKVPLEGRVTEQQEHGLLQNDIRYKLAANGQNALQMACELGHANIVDLLLKAGTDKNGNMAGRYLKVTPLILASMFGHLDVVKSLVEAGVKLEAKDKHGRTATIHATMNGHAHVLAYLLQNGANHLATDSSGNTLLHYSAGYGWYFATGLLVEAGCQPNAENLWKMTPMAIAHMKGHAGLVIKLMKQPGTNVNARIDNTGRTLFLDVCNNGTNSTSLKFLVDELKVDPTCEDFKGNNALHYMATKRVEEQANSEEQLLTSVDACISYLVKLGVNPVKQNLNGSSAILTAALSKNFRFISSILNLGVQIPFEKDNEDNTLLHYMTNHFTKIDSTVHSVFEKLCKNHRSALTEMASTYNKEGCTPLLKFLRKRFSVPNEEYKNKICGIVKTFLEKLKVDVNAKLKCESTATALHLAIGSPILETLLKYKPDLETLDENLQTPLAVATLSGHLDAAEKLLDAGANAHFKSKSEHNMGLALLSTINETKSFYLIPKLLTKGVDAHEVHPVSKNSLLHYIAEKPTLPYVAEALQAVLDAGVNPNILNVDNRTALHLAINARGRETDVLYDVEDILIKAGADLKIEDHLGRIPLHYAFVKIGKAADATFFDPIELVSRMTTSMSPEEMHSRDCYGSSVLHYSAYRGATICSSYLAQTLKDGDIDLGDINGNTPFGLAVQNAHESCALNFYQNNASFLKTINNYIREQDQLPEEKGTQIVAKRKPWKWAFLLEKEDEEEQLHEMQERYPILEQVIKHDWQGMLYLMVGKLQSSGVGLSTGVTIGLKRQRLKLALKLAHEAKETKHLAVESGTLFHTLAKYYDDKLDDDLVLRICQAFEQRGLDPCALDNFGSQAVIYALANHQTKLCEMIFIKENNLLKRLALMEPDFFGRTPFTTLFWEQKYPIPYNVPLQTFAEQLISSRTNPNQLCEYPWTTTSYAGVRYNRKLTNIAPVPNGTKYTPLIAAVMTGCYPTVKWLLTIKPVPGSIPINPNCPDSKGLTPLMHAVRLNDIQMVKLLLDPENYEFEKDLEGKFQPNLKSVKMNVAVNDNSGFTLMDHLIMSPNPESNMYFENIQPIFDMLKPLGALKVKSGNGMLPLERAIKHKRNDVVQLLGQVPTTKNEIWHSMSDFAASFSPDVVLDPKSDFKTTAEKMAERLIDHEKQKMIEKGEEHTLKPQPDPLCGLDIDNAEVIMDPTQNIPFECFLTQVDLNYGIYGLYNFSKMQLVKELRGKKMIILFTQWGRVGEVGQYQKTPFATEKEAIKEFIHNFRYLTGNSWDAVQNFNPIPTKYRLIKKDLRRMKHATAANVDFEQIEKAGESMKSKLPKNLLSLIKNLALVHMKPMDNYDATIVSQNTSPRANYDSLPFLSLDVLKQGNELLTHIGNRIEKRERQDIKAPSQNPEMDKLNWAHEIVKYSEEFYSIIPVFDYSAGKLEPIFKDPDLRQKLIEINCLLNLGLAKSLLLAAQYHVESTNPYEYIYRCLGSSMQLLDRQNPVDKEEAEMILQYIHNTGDCVKVNGIFRVDIPSVSAKLDATKMQNRQLLWHGTSAANVISILQQGLTVAPLTAQVSDALFGKGVYLADMFAKSQHYCHASEINGVTRKYMFLCEAEMGKIWKVNLYDTSENQMPHGYDSLKTCDSRFEPDPEQTILWKGRTVTLGEHRERYFEDAGHWGLDYNEYIIFDESQVTVRYLVEFEETEELRKC